MDPFDRKPFLPVDVSRDQHHRCRARLLSRHGVGSTWRLIDEKEDYAGPAKRIAPGGSLDRQYGDAPIWPGCGAIGVTAPRFSCRSFFDDG